MLDLDETFSKISLGCIEFLDTISSSIKNIPFLQDLGVLTNFLMLDLDKIFSKASLGYIEYLDTISSSIKNIPILQDSSKRLGGHVE